MVINSSFFKFRQQTVTLHKCIANAVCCIIIAVISVLYFTSLNIASVQAILLFIHCVCVFR